MNKEIIAEEGINSWQDKLYRWSPCKFSVLFCFAVILYKIFQLTVVGGNGGERSIEILAYFAFAAVLALVDLLIKWLLNPTTLVLWFLELAVIGVLIFLYLS
jgi:hypothetical protein